MARKISKGKIAQIIIAVIMSIFITSIFIFLFTNLNKLDSQINSEGTELFGEFKLYKNKVYVLVAGNGYYEMNEVDLKTFHPIDDEYYNKHIGIDKNNVYCGNTIFENLDPKKVKALGNNYYSDGKMTYYCGLITQLDNNQKWWKEALGQIKYGLFGGKKPQRFFYTLRLLPSSNEPYYAILNYQVATNGKDVYYEGLPMANANAQTLHRLPQIIEDDKRESDVYFGDGKHVYYENNLMQVDFNEDMYNVRIDEHISQHYLYSPASGMVYVNGTPFEKENAPYKIISKFSPHVNQTLWLSKNGIYFYDTEEKKVKRAGDNVFLDKDFKEIAPLVFSNKNETLYIDAYEIWNDSRHDKSLNSTYTVINRLDGLDPKFSWEMVKDMRGFGSVWKHGKSWYYFDNYGENQLIHNTIYEIKDKQILEKLLQRDWVSSSFIRELINNENFVVPTYTQILQAKTKYDYSDRKLRMIACIAIMILLGMLEFFRKKQNRSSI